MIYYFILCFSLYAQFYLLQFIHSSSQILQLFRIVHSIYITSALILGGITQLTNTMLVLNQALV